MAQLINALSSSKPPLVLIAVDGARDNNPSESALVLRTQETVTLINWQATVETRFRGQNLGLRNAVADAVTWATSQYGSVIVLEDDCIPGPNFIPFATSMLSRFSNEHRIGHINGYNLVAPENLASPLSPIRLTRYPESYAWATWERAWKFYDDDLSWASQSSLKDLQKITNSLTGALRWKINFADAKSERINTWAYRWLASMWANHLSIIGPSVNLVRYDGHEGGTHTRRAARWSELNVSDETDSNLFQSLDFPFFDRQADDWTARHIFHENVLGVCEGVAASLAMEFLKRKKMIRHKGKN
jgi:hypothetical protein